MSIHSSSSVRFLYCVLSVCLFLSFSSVFAFNFYEYITGEWEISRTVVKLSSSSTNSDLTLNDEIRSLFTVQKHNSTVVYSSDDNEDAKEYSLILSGNVFDNDTTANNEIIHEREIRFLFDSPTMGVVKSGIDEDSLRTLFHFDFHSIPSGIALSSGKFYSAAFSNEEEIFYTLNIGALDRFTLTLFPKQWETIGNKEKFISNEIEPVHPFEAAGTPKEIQNYKENEDEEDDGDNNAKKTETSEKPASSKTAAASSSSSSSSSSSTSPYVIIYTAKKVLVPPVKTWWQTYFPFIAIFAFMAIQIYVKSKTTSSALNRQMSSMKKTPTTNAAVSAASKKSN